MDQKTLVKDLLALEALVAPDTNQMCIRDRPRTGQVFDGNTFSAFLDSFFISQFQLSPDQSLLIEVGKRIPGPDETPEAPGHDEPVPAPGEGVHHAPAPITKGHQLGLAFIRL